MFEVVAVDGGQESVDLVRVSRACQAIEERGAFVVVTEYGVVKLLETKVDGGELREVKDVGVLGPERYDDGLGLVEAWDK